MVYKDIGKELPEVWKPEKQGEVLEGVYVQYKKDCGPKKSNLYVFEIEGKLKSVWGSKVLDDRMSHPHIKIGDTLRITYEGKDANKGYHKFKVEKDFPDDETSEEEQPITPEEGLGE